MKMKEAEKRVRKILGEEIATTKDWARFAEMSAAEVLGELENAVIDDDLLYWTATAAMWILIRMGGEEE